MQRQELLWDDVRLFLALCRAPTVGQAAKSLGVDASTASRRLVALEEALGATLFDRGRDGVTATKSAEDLLPVAEEIESAMLRFTSAADQLEREAEGLVRMTCPPDVADVVVTPLIGVLLKKHPKLRLEIDPGEALVDLSRREADIALRTIRPQRGDLIVTKLASVRWLLAASKKVAKEIGTLKSWRDVEWVSWGERLSPNVHAARWLKTHAKDVDPVVRSDKLALQIGIVASGVGAALLPSPSVLHYGLTEVKLAPSLREEAEAWPTDDLYLVTHRALRDVPRIKVVWDLLVSRKLG